jgi:DNA polymerase-3 subunit chi
VTQVDFYILATDTDDARLRAACRIAEKAYRQRQHVMVRAASSLAARQFDELLWTFSQNSFVPHRLVEDGAAAGALPVEPVLISSNEDVAETIPSEIMINLAEAVPDSFSRYLRVIEIVDAEPGRRNSGRERYRFYRDRGYELKTHDI